MRGGSLRDSPDSAAKIDCPILTRLKRLGFG
jgi:hypothetical protein